LAGWTFFRQSSRLLVSSNKMEVGVTHFEDYTEPTGEILTKYMVRVLYRPTGDGNDSTICYMLGKRYSDFKELYLATKDIIPYDYKFPNKSIFNNNAQFTKERRIRGFDELIKHLLRSTEGFVLLKDFIEIEQRLEQHRVMQEHHYPSSPSTPAVQRRSSEHRGDDSEIFEQPPTPSSSSITGHNNQFYQSSLPTSISGSQTDELATRRELQKQAAFLQQKHVEAVAHLTTEDHNSGDSEHIVLTVDEELRARGLRHYLLFALKAAMLFYLAVSLLGIVEVASMAQALLTLVALTVLALLIKLQLDRQEISRSEAWKESR